MGTSDNYRTWRAALADAAKTDAETFRNAVADRFADAPSESDLSRQVTDAESALAVAKGMSADWSALRLDVVRLAVRHGFLAIKRGQRGATLKQEDVATLIGVSQPRVSQMLATIREEKAHADRLATLHAAAKTSGIDRESYADAARSIARNGTDEDVQRAAESLAKGKAPAALAPKASTLDTARLLATVERVVKMSTDVVDDSTDRDAVERACRAMETAIRNLRSAARVTAAA